MIDDGFEESVNEILNSMGSTMKAENEEELNQQEGENSLTDSYRTTIMYDEKELSLMRMKQIYVMIFIRSIKVIKEISIISLLHNSLSFAIGFQPRWLLKLNSLLGNTCVALSK